VRTGCDCNIKRIYYAIRQEYEQVTASDHTECSVNCVTISLMYVGRPGETSERRLLWLWTEAAMMLDWGRSTLDITTAVIVGVPYCFMFCGISLCWCWHCLLTVGGNMLPHTVTPLDVTTVAWCCRQTQDVLHPAEWRPATLQTSQWQWTASVFTTWHCTGSYSSLFIEG